MPCSDSQALNYLEDHRTQRLMSEQKDLEKHVKQLQKELAKSKSEQVREAQIQIKLLQKQAKQFAEKLNITTELLCNATFLMFENNELHNHPHLQTWFNNHTEEDATRMKTDLDKILKRKNGTLQSVIKWYSTLDAKEQWVFATHKFFKGIKLN